MDWDHCAKLAKESGKEIHMGQLFGFCVRKNAELPEGDPRRKLKYRVVFQGNAVVNQDWIAATFSEMNSQPANMEISKICNAKACSPGNIGMQMDIKQAYIQAWLSGPETWVLVPEEAWDRMGKPGEWKRKAEEHYRKTGQKSKAIDVLESLEHEKERFEKSKRLRKTLNKKIRVMSLE